MNQAINAYITGLNNIGRGFWTYAAGIFIQASVLIVLLLVIDFLLRKRVRAVFRYCLWMLLFIKLVLPASFTLPTGVGYWLADYFTGEVSIAKFVSQIEDPVPIAIDIPQGYIPLETPMVNETAAIGIKLEPISWQGLVFLSWLVGMLVLLALLVQRICFVKGLIAQSKPANKRSLDMLEECRSQIGIGRNIELKLSDTALSPAVCGLFKPVILMPASLLEKLSPDKLKAVLIHELAHIKRADVWVNLAQTLLQIVYFYNPLVWIANAMIRRVREQAVDEMVLVTLKPETKSYSNTLIDIAEMVFWRPNFSLRFIGIVESKKALERRIKHMLNRPVPESSKLGFLGLITIVVIGAILLPMACGPAKKTALDTRPAGKIRDEIIVPGLRVGEYTFGISKDDVLESLGKPNHIFYGGNSYTFDNLPRTYYMLFDDVSFRILDDSVKEITAVSPYYKFTNGLGVGDSEQKIKQTFGDDFHLKETEWKDFLTYEDKGLVFEIDKNDRTVMEIGVSPVESLKSHKKADIPATSTINEDGHIVDKTDYPFANDPQVIGGWKSVDFVWDIDEFDPSMKNWQGDLYLNNLIFEEGGDIAGNFLTWTKGLVLSDHTASKYIIREIDGSTYMFFEWKSGDYTIRHMRPHYYVLRKVLAESLKYEPMFGEKAYIPPTSTINEQGHIVDKIDYPFVNDPKVIGTWKGADYVDEIEDFKVDEQQWKGRGGNLFLNEMIFAKNGRLISKNDNAPGGYPGTWTKGLVIYDNDTKTASKYTIKEKDGSAYMFYEWKSGDYSFRHRKPSYYVLKKVSSETGRLAKAWASQPSDAEFARQLPAKIEQLDIDTADLEQVKEIFGKPLLYRWNRQTFDENDLPDRYIMSYPAGFSVFMFNNLIREIRFREPGYVFNDTIQVGSTLDEVLEHLGPPTETIVGKKIEFKDGVLYKDIDGTKGYCYYHRSDKLVRMFFKDYKAIALFVTRTEHKRGLLGIELNDKRWPLVDIIPQMPAEQAGMLNVDKILKVNDKDITHITTIRGALEVLHGEPGQKVKLTVERGEQILAFELERSKK